MSEAPRARDGFFSVWGRRLVTIPLYFALAALLVGVFPALAILAAGVDLVRGRGGVLPLTRALVFFAVYLLCEVGGVLAAGLLWVVTLGGKLTGAARWVELNAALQRLWTAALFGSSVVIFSLTVDVEGLELARSGPLLFFVRHSSTADTVLTAALVANPNRLLLRYVLKRELLWDPCLDIVGRRLLNSFVDRTGSRSEAEVAAVVRLTENLDERSAVLIYPEGTRFEQAKLDRALARLREGGRTDLAQIASTFRHVMPPRLGGALALLRAAPSADLVIVEHTGFEGAATFASFTSGALVKQTLHVRLRRLPARDIPAADRDRWLFEQWAETDRWIAAHLAPGEGAS
jgi:1-acyl-sn-glycerol-3-phosphate acyltransferase